MPPAPTRKYRRFGKKTRRSFGKSSTLSKAAIKYEEYKKEKEVKEEDDEDKEDACLIM